MNELNNLSVVTMFELDLVCLLMILFIAGIGLRYYRLMNRKTNWIILLVQLSYCILLLADSCWVIGKYARWLGETGFYLVNSLYFVAMAFAPYLWLINVCEQMEIKIGAKGLVYGILAIPETVLLTVSVTAFSNHLLFYADAEMNYCRGPWFMWFTYVCYGYIIAASMIALFCAFRAKAFKRYYGIIMAAYAVPILVTGTIQAVMGLSVVSMGVTFSLMLYFTYDVIYFSQMEHARLLAGTELLKKAKQEAEIANEAKSTFLYSMSHDIRTPMNAIMGYADLLEKNKYDPNEVLHYLGHIRQSGNYLIHMIEQVLEMAQLDSGSVVLDLEACDMYEMMNDLMTVMQADAKSRDIAFYSDIKLAHPYIYCDRAKLEQVFINLSSNALKYTTAGGTVKVTVQEHPGQTIDYCRYYFCFEDNGIGMPKEFLSQIYEAFAKNSSDVGRQHDGSGLGLSITRRIVDMMGGTIDIESEPGEGTRVTLTEEFRIAPKPKITYQSRMTLDVKNFRGRRILLAEDNRINREMAEELLKNAGFEVDSVADGIQCVNLLQKSKPGYYDLILMDILMPNMDGHKATQMIRRLPDRRKAHIPIIAMTANVYDEDKRKAMEAGMNGFATKPIELDKLYFEIHRVLA